MSADAGNLCEALWQNGDSPPTAFAVLQAVPSIRRGIERPLFNFHQLRGGLANE